MNVLVLFICGFCCDSCLIVIDPDDDDCTVGGVNVLFLILDVSPCLRICSTCSLYDLASFEAVVWFCFDEDNDCWDDERLFSKL